MLQQDAHAAEGFEHLMFLLTRYRLIEIDILSHLLTYAWLQVSALYISTY